MSPQKIQLAPLAFTQATVKHDHTINSMRDHIEQVLPGLETMDAINPTNFLSQSTALNLGNLKLAAHSHSALKVQRKDNHGNLSLHIPYYGEIVYEINHKQLKLSSGDNIAFLSGSARNLVTTSLSAIMINLDQEQILTTAQTMLSIEPNSSQLDKLGQQLTLDQDRLINISHDLNGTQLHNVIKHISATISIFHQQASLLNQLNFDDLFYRSLVLALNPNLKQQIHHQRSVSRTKIEHICAYINQHLDQPLSLSQLETYSGLSGRTIQRAFLKNLGLTPAQFILEQRLLRARARLLNPQANDNVTQIALSCGFNHLGQFSALYKKQFNELPSITLNKL